MQVLSVFLVIYIITGVLSMLTGCSESYPFQKGATVEATVTVGKDTKVGNSEKIGWEILIPDSVMEDERVFWN